MRNFFILLVTCWIVTFFFSWWILLISALVLGAFLFTSAKAAFTIGFAAGAAAWLIQVLYIEIANQSILSSRIAEMLGAGSGWIVILITTLLGGLLVGPGSLTGYLFRRTWLRTGKHQAAQQS